MKKLDLDLNRFREFITSKKVICYGCGSSGVRAINIMENWGKSHDIIAFVDSDRKKWGQRIYNENFSYPIVSISDALKLASNNTIFLITCVSDVLELRMMLNSYEELDSIECFSLVEIAQQQLLSSDYEEIVHESKEAIIPKKIHYCWLGGKKPLFIQRMVDSWKQLCPDYEIFEWNESNYDFTKNKYMKEAYEAKVWAFVPDFARIDIVYNQGGIYLDTDIKILKKLDELLYQRNFFISDCSFQVNLGAGFGAKAGEPILKEFMDYYKNVSFQFEDGRLNKLGCVAHQYNVLKKYGMEINDKFQVIRGANIYPMILGGTNAHTMQMRKSDKAFLAHYGMGGWSNATIEGRRKMRDYYQHEELENYDIDGREI